MATPLSSIEHTVPEQLEIIGQAAVELLESVQEAQRVRHNPDRAWNTVQERIDAETATYAQVGAALVAVAALVPPR